MGSSGLEPPTSRLSGVRSNRLSYEPRRKILRIYLFKYSFFKSGGHLFSHIVSNIVPSAGQVLTVVFGMRTGVTPNRIATRNLTLCSGGKAIGQRIRHQKFESLNDSTLMHPPTYYSLERR